MRTILVAFIALVAALGSAQDLKETHGKTNAQIIAMGYDKWYGFYTKLEGESTMGMSSAAVLYASALAWQNDGIIAKQAPVKQSQSKKLRELFGKFADDMANLGKTFTGGGTMWTVIGAGFQVDVEETLYALLGGHAKAAPHLVVSKVDKELESVRKELVGMGDKDFYGVYTRDEAMKSLSDAKQVYQELVKFAKYRSRADSDRILGFCLDRVNDARQQEPKR